MPIRLAAFDLDGTLIRGVTCVEAIARQLGRTRESEELERLSMRDVAGLTAAREAMAVWCRPCTPDDLAAGLSGIPLAPGAAEAFALLRAAGVTTAIVSITWSRAVEWFGELLGADHAYGTRLSASGIEHVWPADKGRWLAEHGAALGLERSQIAAVGDSDGDRELLEAAGMRFYVGSTAPSITGTAHLPDADIAEIARRILAAP